MIKNFTFSLYVFILFVSYTTINAQCYVKLSADKLNICPNQTATINAISSEVSILNDFSSQKRLFETQSLKLDQTVKSLINTGVLYGLNYPFNQFIDNVVLDMPNIKLQSTLISSGKLEVTILTDLIQDNKIVFEFPYIKRNNISIKDSILFDGKTLTVGQNSITKTIDLSGTSIDFSVGNSSTFNTVQYKVNSRLKITTTKFTGDEVGDIKISLKDINYLTNTVFTWYKDGTLISNQNSSALLVNEPGKYSVNTTSNCGNSSDFIVINTNTNLKVNVSADGDTIFCQGKFVNLNATNDANFTYQWFNNDQPINGANSYTYQVFNSGTYSVKIADSQCTGISKKMNVMVNQYPSNELNLSGSTTICQGENLTITAIDKGSYLWSNGEKTQSIVVDKTGVYSVSITQNGCTSVSNQITTTVKPLPVAKITPQGNTTFCQDGSVNLVASGGENYQWSNGSYTSSITVNQSGTYFVTVIDLSGCQSVASQTITVNPLPILSLTTLDLITFKNAEPIQLIANPNGGIFSGEGVRGTIFDPTKATLGSKVITYVYTSPQGCQGSTSINTVIVDSIGNVCTLTKYDTLTVTNNITKYDTVFVNKTIYDTITITKYDTIHVNDTVSILKIKFQLTTGIKANQFTSMSVYPNPTSDILIIDASDLQALKDYRYRLLDMQGKEIYNAFITNAKTEIPLKTLGTKGVYILHLMDANNESIQTKQIVLE